MFTLCTALTIPKRVGFSNHAALRCAASKIAYAAAYVALLPYLVGVYHTTFDPRAKIIVVGAFDPKYTLDFFFCHKWLKSHCLKKLRDCGRAKQTYIGSPNVC